MSHEPLIVGADPPPNDRSGSAWPLLVAGAIVAVVMVALAVGRSATGPADADDAQTEIDSSLLHELGSPVDTVERFVVALNYGFVRDLAAVTAPDAGRLELPFQDLSPSLPELRDAVATFGEIDGTIDMHGCKATRIVRSDTVEVECAVAYDSDFVRELRAENLRGRMVFEVRAGLVAGISVSELEQPGTDRGDVDALFEDWLIDRLMEPARRP